MRRTETFRKLIGVVIAGTLFGPAPSSLDFVDQDGEVGAGIVRFIRGGNF